MRPEARKLYEFDLVITSHAETHLGELERLVWSSVCWDAMLSLQGGQRRLSFARYGRTEAEAIGGAIRDAMESGFAVEAYQERSDANEA